MIVKRIMEESPVDGYQLFRYAKLKPDGTTSIVPSFYIRHGRKEICIKTDRLKDAKIAVKKMAGEDSQIRRRRTANLDETTVGQLLDLGSVCPKYHVDLPVLRLSAGRPLCPPTFTECERSCSDNLLFRQ
jgi:hypothetical protein